MEKFIPYRDGMEIGYGFNTLTGEVRGQAVEGHPVESDLSGQDVGAKALLVESQEQMLESLNVSVEAGARYGMFSGEAKFGLSDACSYTAQSTYVVARCQVANAYRGIPNASLSPDAKQRIVQSGPESFQKGYGDAWIRGVKTGGQLYAIFQLTASSTEKQKEVAVALRADVQALVASGSLKASLDYMEKTTSAMTSVSTMFYQRSGAGDSSSPVSNPSEIAQRLRAFPGIARANPVGYAAQIIDYDVLNVPPFDEIGFRQRGEALDDFAKMKLQWMSARAEIDLVQRNTEMFIDLPSSTDLQAGFTAYTEAINALNKHARRVANREADPDLFVPTQVLPNFVFVKKAPDAERVDVPDILGMTVGQATDVLRSRGLEPSGNASSIPDGSPEATNLVTFQHVAAHTQMPPGTKVVFDYKFKAIDRFKWLIRLKERPVQIAQVLAKPVVLPHRFKLATLRVP